MLDDRKHEKKKKVIKQYRWPRRRVIRKVLKMGIDFFSRFLINWEVTGKENIPAEGPLLIVGNHFHFLDTIAPIHSTRWPLEFIGDMVMPNAPPLMRLFPNAWQTLKIQQGAPNIEALQASQAVLAQNGVLVIYPEGHAFNRPLRPALPGAAYMALRTGVPILPMGTVSDNDWKLFQTISEKKRRMKVFTKIGEVFGPIETSNPERPNREEIMAAGNLIMTKIAALLPDEFRGDFRPNIA